MKFLNPRARQVAEARAIDAALTIARVFEWKFDGSAPVILGPSMQTFLYVPDAELLLIPSIDHTGGQRGQVTELMREARSDALVVKVGRARDGAVQVFAEIALWSPSGCRWQGSHCPWVEEGGDAMVFAPNPDDDFPESKWFGLRGPRLGEINSPVAYGASTSRGIMLGRALFPAMVWEF